MLKTIVGVALAFALGAFCRWIDIPVPAPNRLIGALLVLAVTLGYLAADGVLPPQDPPPAHEKTRDGPETAAGE